MVYFKKKKKKRKKREKWIEKKNVLHEYQGLLIKKNKRLLGVENCHFFNKLEFVKKLNFATNENFFKKWEKMKKKWSRYCWNVKKGRKTNEKHKK